MCKNELNIDEVKNIELNMLKYVHELCVENGIKYTLDAGTLLGAIRHKGFIPWDDDVDILVPREQYNKLLEIIKKDKNSPYKVLSMYNCDDYFYSFAKIIDNRTYLREKGVKKINDLGVYLDVFPIDNLPNNKYLRVVHQFIICIKRNMAYYLSCEKDSVVAMLSLKRFVSQVLSCNNLRRILHSVEKSVNRYNKKTCNFCANVVGAVNPYITVPKDIFEERILTTFEDGEFYIPKRYHNYLEILYGDYMTPPPEEKRVYTHGFSAYMRTDN